MSEIRRSTLAVAFYIMVKIEPAQEEGVAGKPIKLLLKSLVEMRFARQLLRIYCILS